MRIQRASYSDPNMSSGVVSYLLLATCCWLSVMYGVPVNPVCRELAYGISIDQRAYK